MEFVFQVPTKIIAGEECLVRHKELLAGLGKKALIVKSGSAEKNGALSDIRTAMDSIGIAYHICNNVSPNPTPQEVRDLQGYDPSYDFIVAVGGGSALDAAKGVAVLTVNDIPAQALYEGNFKTAPLPMIAIPTTCGTGSEVTAVSVLTVGETKKSFGNPGILPKIAFLDPRYLKTLPRRVMLDTALDALSHNAEAYLILDSAPTEMVAEEAFRQFADCIAALKSGEVNDEDRSRLLYIATLGGIAIYAAGTSAVHAMGYPITTLAGVPHGRACAYTLGEYVEFAYDARRAKVDKMCALLKVDGVSGFQQMLSQLMGDKPVFTSKELDKLTGICVAPAVAKPSAKKLTAADVRILFGKAFGER
ncbi:MAG: iron-containing alcohol dehydrogenase [Christensenella sp.]|nr:iron-containing alcohol dehydrogenase [Christensenella sp.]